MKKWMQAAVMFVMFVMIGCGSEPTDRPEDCRQGEYFNEANKKCLSCPAVQEPQCREGCGLEIYSDQRGCPLARCESGCEGCSEDEVYDASADQCVEAEPA